MCGRYTDPSSYDEMIEEFSITNIVPDLSELEVRYNIAPTQMGTVVINKNGEHTLDRFFWTFIAPWPKDGKPSKYATINARDDKLFESKLYSPSFKTKRCIVPAGGFYEWCRAAAPKQPYYIHRADNRPLAFAGVWSPWRARNTGETLYSFAIVTTSPNEVMKPIHDRMPVILDKSDHATWLDVDNADTDMLDALLKPCPDEWLEAYPVSTYVNKTTNDGPACMERDSVLQLDLPEDWRNKKLTAVQR